MNNNLLNIGQIGDGHHQKSSITRHRFESSEFDIKSKAGQFSALQLREDETQSSAMDRIMNMKDATIEQCDTFSTNSTCTASKKEEAKENNQFELDSLSMNDFSDNNSCQDSKLREIKINDVDVAPNYRFSNIFKHNRRTNNHHGVVICGHRGGFKTTKSPENTMMAFERAVEIGMMSIELDIWLTKDDKLVIIHGGDHGEMPATVDQPEKKQYIFNMTLDEIREQFTKSTYWLESDMTENCQVPLLSELFSLMAEKQKLLMNLEIKTPYMPELKKQYRMEECVRKTLDLVQEYGLTDYSMIQSFDHNVVKTAESMPNPIPTLYLHNWEYYIPPPSAKIMSTEQGTGGHMQIVDVTPELVEEMHRNNKIVAVWIDLSVPEHIYSENEEFYKKIYDLGVDMLTTDNCIQAQESLLKYHQENKHEI